MVNSREKGKKGERQVVILLNEYFTSVCLTGFQNLLKFDLLYAERNLQQTRSGGYDIGIWLRPISGEPILRAVLEVKTWKKLTAAELEKHWQQAQKQASAVHKKPILAYRQNRQPWRFRVMAKDALASNNIDGWVEMESGPFLQVIERFMD